jgi:hypothetical protein
VLEGVGRTLKGRDLRQVRNAIWRQTGFLDWFWLFLLLLLMLKVFYLFILALCNRCNSLIGLERY